MEELAVASNNSVTAPRGIGVDDESSTDPEFLPDGLHNIFAEMTAKQRAAWQFAKALRLLRAEAAEERSQAVVCGFLVAASMVALTE